MNRAAIAKEFLGWVVGTGRLKKGHRTTRDEAQRWLAEFAAEQDDVLGAVTAVVAGGSAPAAVDDFQQMIVDRSRAMAEAGGDDLARDAILQEKDRAKLTEKAAFVNPVSAITAILGGSATVGAPNSDTSPQVYGGISAQTTGLVGGVVTVPRIFAPIEVAAWDAPDSDTRPVTCSFGGIQLVPVTALAGVRPYGLVKFGTRGNLQDIYVDICRGCQFTVPASQIRLLVGLDPTAGGISQNSTMTLNGMLSFNPVIRTTPIYRTVYLDKLTVANVPNINVPPFANRLWFWRANFATTAVQIIVADTTGVTLYDFVLAANTVMTAPIQLSSDAALINITVTAGAANVQARVIFELSL